jgi:hypothetical protein
MSPFTTRWVALAGVCVLAVAACTDSPNATQPTAPTTTAPASPAIDAPQTPDMTAATDPSATTPPPVAPVESFPEADSTRIQFPPGTSGTTVAGTVDAELPALYVLTTDAGQQMDLSLTGSGHVAMSLFDPAGRLLGAGATGMSLLLPTAGTYGLAIVAADAEMESDASSSFTLDVSIVGTAVAGACLDACRPPVWQLVDQRFVQGVDPIDAQTVQFFDPSTGQLLAAPTSAANIQMLVGPPPPERGLTYVSSRTAVTLATSRLISVFANVLYASPQRATVAEAYDAVIWDIGQQRVVRPQELFRGSDDGVAAWNAIRPAILDALAAHFEGNVDRSHLESIDLGEPANHALTLTQHGLQIGIDKCDVFDCATGSAVVEIPYTQLQTVLQPQWLLGATETWSASALDDEVSF